MENKILNEVFTIEQCGFDSFGANGCDLILAGKVKDISNYLVGLSDFELSKLWITKWVDGKKIYSINALEYKQTKEIG